MRAGDADGEPVLVRDVYARRCQATKLNRYVPGEFPWGDVNTRNWSCRDRNDDESVSVKLAYLPSIRFEEAGQE